LFVEFFMRKDMHMGCSCGRLRRENDELRRRLEQYESGSDEFDEGEYDEDEDVSDLSDRFDEPSAPAGDSYDSLDYDPRRAAGQPGGRLHSGPGSAYPKDAGAVSQPESPSNSATTMPMVGGSRPPTGSRSGTGTRRSAGVRSSSVSAGSTMPAGSAC
jgi:hypothetical protein